MVDNDEIGGLVVDNDEIGGHDRKMSEQVEFLWISQSEFEQEQELFNHAEMHEGGGDAKRARQKRAQVISEVKLPGSWDEVLSTAARWEWYERRHVAVWT